MDSRPHCLKPSACVAKGDRHCRSCAGTASAARLWANPEQVEKARSHLAAINRDPVVRTKQVETLKRNRIGMASIRRCAKAKLARISADPDLGSKRIAAIRAASERMIATKRSTFAKSIGIPVDLVPEYRRLRKSHQLSREETIGVLRSSYRASFADLDQTCRVAEIRSAGPMPAIGMPARAAWTQKIAHAARLAAEGGGR